MALDRELILPEFRGDRHPEEKGLGPIPAISHLPTNTRRSGLSADHAERENGVYVNTARPF
ncbi:hypothetical protein An01g12790 [Aspergillus niger]|uniref:Uncharacterized protein n=2 Tax=Aspergillus niger TaxID=5061 RepID=A2QAU5_ASPNC|nr:hypothetical protein An01g12790 [Aspergillus niger]CAK37329.1 hypothetical protein An01g12790 [Aspergillus niger]